MFDLLIKGGEVVDEGAGYRGLLDVAIKRDRIVAVDKDIPSTAAFEVIDATGQYVTPGLIDLHTHVYEKVTFWGINADSVASRTGVTTWLDAGSAGALTLPGFRDFIVKPSTVRIYALLNISYLGLVAPDYELSRLEFCDVDLFERMVNLNRDLVVGVKVRMGTSTVGENGIVPMQRAREAAERCGLPLMVHIAAAPPDLRDVVSLLRPGDIITHCFTGNSMRIVDDTGKILDFVKRIWDQGVVLDIGHGSGSFSFEVAEALIAAGYKPDVISTDIHQLSIGGPMYDLPTTLSKFLCLGLSFPEVIQASTTRPASLLGLANEIGTLKPGARADVALFQLAQGRFPFYDTQMQVREGTTLIHNTLTLVHGRPLLRQAPQPRAPWISWARAGADVEVLAFQQHLEQQGHTPDGLVAQVQG